MHKNSEKKSLIFAIFFLSLGGWMLHYRIHPPSQGIPANYFPFIIGLVNILFVPLLLNFRKMFLYGYLINGFSVIFGVILMSAFSLSKLPQPLSMSNIIFKTTLADIFLLLPKLFIGQRILYIYFPQGTGRMFRGWWWVKHFFYLSLIFAAGHFLWR